MILSASRCFFVLSRTGEMIMAKKMPTKIRTARPKPAMVCDTPEVPGQYYRAAGVSRRRTIRSERLVGDGGHRVDDAGKDAESDELQIEPGMMRFVSGHPGRTPAW